MSCLDKYKELNQVLQDEDIETALSLLNAGYPVNCSIKSNKNTPLHHAVRLESYELVQTLLFKGALISSQNSIGDTALHAAFKTKNDRIIDLIFLSIDHTDFDNLQNRDGLSHMHVACAKNKTDIVERFLKQGIDIDICVNSNSPSWPGYTALHFAAEFNSIDVLDLLLKKGADINVVDASNSQARQLAFMNSQKSSVAAYRLLTDVERSHMFNEMSLHIACSRNDHDIVAEYVKFAGSIDTPSRGSEIYNGDTPLHCAARKSCKENCKILVDSGAKLHILNEFDMTPLHSAFYQECIDIEHRTEVVDYLLTVYDLKTSDNKTDVFDLSYLHIACSRGDLEAVERFIKNGADINITIQRYCPGMSWDNVSPLIFAVKFNQVDTTKLLLKNGAEIDVSFYGSNTIFKYASQMTDEMVQTILLNTPSMKNIVDHYGDNVYSLILKNLNLEVRDQSAVMKKYYKILEEIGCDINHKNCYGNTLLHGIFAQRSPEVEFIKIVLDNGADINTENNKGQIVLNRNLERYDQEEDIFFIFYSHIEKLKMIGHYVNQKCIDYCQKIWDARLIIDPNHEYFTNENINATKEKFSNELRMMREVAIGDSSTMYSLLVGDINTISVYSNNIRLKHLVDSEEFTEQYPSYGYLFKRKMKEGKARRVLLLASMDVLSSIIKNILPIYSIEIILGFLTNEELEYLCRTSSCP